VTVGNAGPDTAQAVTLTDNLPNSLVYVSATPGREAARISPVWSPAIWEHPQRRSGERSSCGDYHSPWVLTNNASVTSSTADPIASNNSAS